jgi:hypothetical protein
LNFCKPRIVFPLFHSYNPFERKRLEFNKKGAVKQRLSIRMCNFFTELFFYKLLKGLEERFGFNGLCQMGVQTCLQAAQQNANGLFAVYGKSNLNKKQPC